MGGWHNAGMTHPQDISNKDGSRMQGADQPQASSCNMGPSGEYTHQPMATTNQSLAPPHTSRHSTWGAGFQAGLSDQGWPWRPSQQHRVDEMPLGVPIHMATAIATGNTEW